jgi:hypothetical protein
MNKQLFYINLHNGSTFIKKQISGYYFEYGDYKFIVRKDENQRWDLSEYTTGLRCNIFRDTRKDVISEVKEMIDAGSFITNSGSQFSLNHFEEQVKYSIREFGYANQ